MPDESVLRVVVVRRGKVRAIEFRLREGEVGLSLFRAAERPEPEAIIAAVRAAGKQGELGLAEVPVRLLHRLGLRLVRTPGGTPDPAVNASGQRFARRGPAIVVAAICVAVAGRAVHEWFNQRVMPALAAAAKLLE